MAPSPSTELRLTADDAAVLLELVETTIVEAVAGRRPTLPALTRLPATLHEPTGCFVTLTVAGRLNGCIGSIEPREPLGHAAPRLALSAAFADPRLPALRAADLPHLGIEVSLLSPLEPMAATSRAELRAEVRPGVDGVLIEAGERSGLFLPTVWEQLPDPDEFLDRLWHKAGLVPPTWHPGMAASRFTARVHAA